MNKTPWQVSDITGAEYLGTLEFQDKNDDWQVFQVLKTKERLVFGDSCNTGFLESGYIEREEFEANETLQELQAELETFYNDGPSYVSRIVVNDRM
jgi:hypothetical protein